MVHGIAINTAAIIAFLCRMHNTYGPLEIHRPERTDGHLKFQLLIFHQLRAVSVCGHLYFLRETIEFRIALLIQLTENGKSLTQVRMD